jgi:hypothetical protein
VLGEETSVEGGHSFIVVPVQAHLLDEGGDSGALVGSWTYEEIAVCVCVCVCVSECERERERETHTHPRLYKSQRTPTRTKTHRERKMEGRCNHCTSSSLLFPFIFPAYMCVFVSDSFALRSTIGSRMPAALTDK